VFGETIRVADEDRAYRQPPVFQHVAMTD
jgi:hypothetical protein